jgi:protoporphyrinogen oxidase
VPTPQTALILGGGLAGLVCADELSRAGVAVTVVEQHETLGGLARNVTVGEATFDLGGHRFFTDQPAMIAWIETLLADKLLRVKRKSRIRLGGRYFDYPLRPFNAVSGFGLRQTSKILLDYCAASLRRRLADATDLSLEDWVVQRFGRELFDIYFGPYSVKAWGVPCDQISAEWAQQRIQLLGLADAVLRALRSDGKPKTYAGQFWYPRGGIGVLAESLTERILAQGGKLLPGRRVEGIEVAGGRVTGVRINDDIQPADLVVSTIPLTDLGAMIGAPSEALGRLSYRALRCVFLLIDVPQVTDDTWLYFSDPDVLFGRSHEPRNWDPGMAPPGKTSLCLEVFCDEGDALWSLPGDELIDRCAADLARLGLVERGKVIGGKCVAVPSAYPVFRVGYREPLDRVLAAVAAVDGLHVTGRTGAYRYENMDQVAEQAIALAGRLVQP